MANSATFALPDCMSKDGTDIEPQCITDALRRLPPRELPLHAACCQGGLVDDDDIAISVLSVSAGTSCSTARIGVFFAEIIGGCNCHDDPHREARYAVFDVTIDHGSGLAELRLSSAAAGADD